MSRICTLALVALTLAVTLTAANADSGRGRHKKIYAVPASGKINIDGDLGDWDLSGQILMYVVSDTAQTQAAKFAMMYDKDALYISGDVRDPHPLMNRHDPLVDPDKGWDGDACQVRLVVDPKQGYPVKLAAWDNAPDDQMVHMTLWYYTDKKEPVLQYQTGMNYALPKAGWKGGVVPNDLYQAAYKLAPDGHGYTFEYRIPWTTVQATDPPKAGDLITGTVQFDWAQADGLHTAGGGAWAYDVMGVPGFSFQSSACWGKVIFSPTNHISRDLVEEGIPPAKPEPLSFAYNLPASGDVTIQLFDDKGAEVRTLAAAAPRLAGKNVEHWDGTGDDGKPLAAGTYVWRGLTHDHLTQKFILSAHNSGQPPYKTDDGTGGWGGDEGNVTSVCACPGGVLMSWSVSESGWGIIRTDVNGKKLWGSRHNAQDLATDGKSIFAIGDDGYTFANTVKVFSLDDGRPIDFGDGNSSLAPPPGGAKDTDVASGVAYGNGKIYASWAQRDMVSVYDSTSGDLLDTWSVPAPGRLAVLADGRVAVISGKRVVTLSKAGVVDLGLTHIDSPTGLAAGKAASEAALYVANTGAMQDVTVFGSDGKYLRTIGKVGGRPRVGDYDSSGILEPGGISLDEAGKLWVAETLDAPKRVSAWRTDTGALAGEYFGSSDYFGWAYMDPTHPDELYCHNVMWKVNLTTGACRPISTIWRGMSPNMVSEADPGGYGGHFKVITAANGHQYGFGMADYGEILYERSGDIFKPICGLLRVLSGSAPGTTTSPYPVLVDPAKFPASTYFWQDKNDDQSIQADEVTAVPFRSENGFDWIDKDLNAWCNAGFVLRPVKVAPDGRPWYDVTQKETLPFSGSLTVDASDGSIFTLDSSGGKPGLAHYSSDYKQLWGYPAIVPWYAAINLPMVRAGNLAGLTTDLGIAGDFTGASDYFGPYHIFTRDGLYVGMAMRDGRTGGLGADVTASEVYTGELVKPAGMDRYFLLAGDQDGRVTEIFGLNTVKRLNGGTLDLRPADVSSAAAAMEAYRAQIGKSVHLEIVRGKSGLESAPTVGKVLDDTRAFTAAAAYDDKDLYVQYEVTSPNALVSSYTDPQRIFKGGNALDIQIATDPAADPKRTKPALGDIRLLITQQSGKPVAVLYRPVVAGFTGQPIVLTSPTGSEPFDAIRTDVPVTLEYTKTPVGFNVTATVALSDLGWTPAAGSRVRMDLGYLFGNATGNVIAARAYWSNDGFEAGVTNDVPNESRLTPNNWGEAVVE